ncbi:MAG: response regulator [Proteobacteria bacterium]|nr:response regulator [Pseudomonadota bacterium]
MDGRPIVILLVEDDVAHAEIVRRNLESFRVANALIHLPDGQQALDYLEASSAGTVSRPDLVLLDLRLPKVDGLEVLERLKANEALSNIPVVILTTSDAERDVVAAYQRGAVSYLTKPVDFGKFVELMEAFGFYWLVWNRFPSP